MSELILGILGLAATATPMDIQQLEQTFYNQIPDHLLEPMEVEEDRSPRRMSRVDLEEYFRIWEQAHGIE